MKNNKDSHYKTYSTTDNKEKEQLLPCVKLVNESWDAWDQHWSSKLTEFESYYDRWIGKPPDRDESCHTNG